MRKASAFRRSWCHHLYRASVRESTELLLRTPQVTLFLGPSTSSIPDVFSGSSASNRPWESLIEKTDQRKALRTLSLFSKSTTSGVTESAGLAAGSSDGFSSQRIQSVLRECKYRSTTHHGPQNRALHTTTGTGRDDREGSISGNWTSPIVQRLNCDETGSDVGGGRQRELQNETRKLQEELVTAITNLKDSEFSLALQSGERNPITWGKSGVVQWNVANVGLSLSSTSESSGRFRSFDPLGRRGNATLPSICRLYSSGSNPPTKSEVVVEPLARDYSQRAVVTALWCNFLVFSLKLGVWIMTSSHVMLAEAIHSLADLANQGLLAYGLMSSKRAPDALHPYGYTKERFVWSLISAVGIFCLGSGATIIHGVQNLFNAQPLENTYLAALVIGGSMIMEGASLLVAISCVRNGAKAEGMTIQDYLWRGHDPTTVAVMMEDGAAVAGLGIAAAALAAAHYTGNPMWDPIGSIVVGNLLGGVAIFLIQRNRHALLGRSMDDKDMMRVITLLSKDPVVDAIYDCKSEVIGPGAYRFKAEIDFNGVVIVQNYLKRAGRGNWHKEFHEAVSSEESGQLDRVMAAYGEEVVSALGSEVDRLEKEIQKIVPGIRHVDIEAHNPQGPAPREKLYIY